FTTITVRNVAPTANFLGDAQGRVGFSNATQLSTTIPNLHGTGDGLVYSAPLQRYLNNFYAASYGATPQSNVSIAQLTTVNESVPVANGFLESNWGRVSQDPGHWLASIVAAP